MSTADSKYVPIGERVQQDVWHDNFVPKYSALATATPSRLVLAGVWLLFLPGILAYGFILLAEFSNWRNGSIGLTFVNLVFGLGTIVLFSVILWQQTVRYCRYQPPAADDGDSDDDL